MNVSGIVHLKTGHEGTEGNTGIDLLFFLTSALDGNGWSTPSPGRFEPGKHPVPTV